MQQRKLGSFTASEVSFGCMNLSHAYGAPLSEEDGIKMLHAALDAGYTHFDTATMYGAGRNEELVAKALGPHRDKFVLASKCGLYPGKDGPREINGRPERIKQACEDSLRRLKTDVIDLYYLHRLDRNVPIEESVGALSELVSEGKIKSIGLSEMSAETVRRGHSEHPITALQTEYSLWTRNAEIAVLEATKELGIAFVAFSPMARGFLSGKLQDVSDLYERDIRRNMPRFQPDTYAQNLKLLDAYGQVAQKVGCTMAELAIAWVLSRGEHIIALPGTTSLAHMEENARGASVEISPEIIAELDDIINQTTVVGGRYSVAQQPDVDTEEFA